MEEATKRLNAAEESALDHQKRAIRDPSTAHQSAIYPVGAEYALCHAETQLMGAVVAVLNESLTESLRGFYKLRKAFGTLWEISEAERKYLERKGLGSGSKGASKTSLNTTTDSSRPPAPNPFETAEDDDDDLEFVDAPEELSKEEVEAEQMSRLGLSDQAPSKVQQPKSALPSSGAAAEADADVDFRTVTSDPIDLFIHSGTALCYGLLQLMLSMIPPTFAKLLSLTARRQASSPPAAGHAAAKGSD